MGGELWGAPVGAARASHQVFRGSRTFFAIHASYTSDSQEIFVLWGYPSINSPITPGGRAESRARDAARSTRPSSTATEIRHVLLILIPLVWLAVMALVVAACQTAARADGDAGPVRPTSAVHARAEGESRRVRAPFPTPRAEPPRPREQVSGVVRAPASAALPP